MLSIFLYNARHCSQMLECSTTPCNADFNPLVGIGRIRPMQFLSTEALGEKGRNSVNSRSNLTIEGSIWERIFSAVDCSNCQSNLITTARDIVGQRQKIRFCHLRNLGRIQSTEHLVMSFSRHSSAGEHGNRCHRQE